MHVCVCVLESERENGRKRENDKANEEGKTK